ncbi:hypothetical protein MOA67_gp304 [Klebsiella phage KpLz-2_45]|uniref:hypothetical protein n=1 Tax=Klebsiella phage KpLz-2_45 TaxID=2698923 RepID=UPI001F12EBC9|nr:hypothetical protein MOA67_gp304 [Klebsiella phage KpLz-2_45]UKS72119.1 hypothetical protein KpLz245_2530 [Klebsiella phage KpLz-2_45]DAX11232.1 MAG TPA: hypothetical protein [Bacteriophage sp.]
MAVQKYLFEIPPALKVFTDGYKGLWRDQIIDAFLSTAYHWEKGKAKDYNKLFIEIYYSNNIDPLESDFETIPDDPYYRDQLSFYMSLQEEIEKMKNTGVLEKILSDLRSQWDRYGIYGECYTERMNSRTYLVYR